MNLSNTSFNSFKRTATGFIVIVLAILLFPQQSPARFVEQNTPAAERFPEDQISYEGPRIVVNLPARQLYLYDKDHQLVKTYPIAIGMNRYPTPIGPREMHQIVWNPWWLPPKGRDWTKNAKDTPPGPHNPLGPVKMNLGNAILFHGTNKPYSIGHLQSHACMRMYSEDARELARHLQERVTDQNDPALFEKYQKHNRSSFYVNLTQKVPVDIVYEIAQVRDGRLYVYQDVYWRVRNKREVIESKLVSAGYKPEKFDWNYLEGQIKESKNRKDLEFELNELTLTYRKKLEEQKHAVVETEGQKI